MPHVHKMPDGKGLTGPAIPVTPDHHIHTTPKGPTGDALNGMGHTHVVEGKRTGPEIERT